MARLLSILPLVILLTGCVPHAPTPPASGAKGASSSSDTLAPGVIHHAIPTGSDSGIDLIDVDLAHTHARIAVAAESIGRVDGLVTGQAYTPHEWLDKTHALAATNGGYFGHDVGGDRKEIVGLLVLNGRVRRAQSPLQGHGSANVRAGLYIRSAFGLSAQGQPQIAWAATDSTAVMAVRTYTVPNGVPQPESFWAARNIVGCGPTLLHNGKVFVTDRQERLVSPGPEPRTFVAYDGPADAPRHFVLGMASGMTYSDLAAFLAAYFPRYDRTQPADAMCLDGGASTQLSYRLPDGNIQSPRETGTTVPNAIVVLPR